jgi:FixJ family two-component response regulator
MIYIIEDDTSIIRGFELFLKSAGMEFRSFESAIDFLDQCRPGVKDILVLDLNLPGMSGCDLLKRLAEEDLHIPVIVVTAFDDAQNRETCREYGVKAYLRKPVDGEALIDIIKYNQPSTYD